MRGWLTGGILGAALMLSASVARAVDNPLPGWLTGAWELQSDELWGDEFWTPPRGKVMIGSGRIGKGDKLITFESMRIGYDADGKLAFWAYPNWSEEPTKFTKAKQGDSEIVFENAEHDYPQRVRYWRDGKQLKAEISMIDGSNVMQLSFTPMGGD